MMRVQVTHDEVYKIDPVGMRLMRELFFPKGGFQENGNTIGCRCIDQAVAAAGSTSTSTSSGSSSMTSDGSSHDCSTVACNQIGYLFLTQVSSRLTLTLLSYSLIFSLNMLAASTLAGLTSVLIDLDEDVSEFVPSKQFRTFDESKSG